jgi:asparagine synthase (glutamine-hydrolysing)
MVKAIHHEGFYETGTWVNEGGGVYVGWTAIEHSFSAGMPVFSDNGKVTLIFSGEEYPPTATLAYMKEQGHPGSDNPASYLAHWYEKDHNFPAGLNGLFHGLVADVTRGTALLFNDRYGMHRLYYHESSDALYFAAEAKAIMAVLPELRKPDQRSLGEFVACSCVLEDRSLFQQIYVLPAASAWVVRDGCVERKGTYFRPQEWEEQDPLDPEGFHGQLRDVLSHNLPRYFAGDQRIGIALTGGMDTRAIMAWQKSSRATLPCYTFGGMFRECRDVQVARRVAECCGQRHEVIRVDRDFLSQFASYAERTAYLTEGCADVYRAPDLYVSERARRIAPVKVVGTYGSEVVRHAVMFKPVAPLEGLFHQDFLSSIERARQTYSDLRRQHPVTFAAFRQSPWYHHGVLALEQTQLTVRSPFLDNDFVRTVFRAPLGSASNGDIRLRLIADGDSALSRIPSDRGIGGDLEPIRSAISRALLEFSFKAEYAYDYGMPQWLAMIDHQFSWLHLERLFLGRHKFSHFRVWYRDQLAEYVQQILLDPVALHRPYLDRKVLIKVVRNHVKGNRNYTTTIHKLLTLELLHRIFLDAR